MSTCDNTDRIATLIHISDLHFGDKFITDEDVFKKLLANLPFIKGTYTHSYQAIRALAIRVKQILKNRKESRIPAGVVFTGDLTSSGEEGEFVVGKTFLTRAYSIGYGTYCGLDLGDDRPEIDFNTSPALFYVPGNHDIWKRNHPDQLAAYLSHFSGNFPKTWKLITKSRPIFLNGLDSTQNTILRHRLARGRVRPEQLDGLCQKIELLRAEEKNAIHIVFLHHPLIGASGRSWDPTMELDDRRAIATRLNGLADIVLSGHIHQDFLLSKEEAASSNEPFMPNHAVAGTAAQQFSERNFLLLDIYERKICLQVFEYDRNSLEFVPNITKEKTFILSEEPTLHTIYKTDNYVVIGDVKLGIRKIKIKKKKGLPATDR